MKQTFTPNHLLMSAYGELAPHATTQLQEEVFCNDILNNELQEILDLQMALDSFALQPSKTSIDLIFEHCREAEIHA